MLVKIRKTMLNLIILTAFISCKNIAFEPSIIFNENDGKTEVRITLPEGGSKIIKVIDGPLFESGEGDLGIGILDSYSLENNLNDKTFKNISKYFAKIAETNNIFFIYKNDKNMNAVYWESTWVAGVSDSGIIFQGDIENLKRDEIQNIVASNSAEDKVLIFSGKSYDITGRLENRKYVLITNGNILTIYSCMDDKLLFTEKGKLVNGKIYIEDNNSELTYTITNSNLCIGEEGEEMCFSKIK